MSTVQHWIKGCFGVAMAIAIGGMSASANAVETQERLMSPPIAQSTSEATPPVAENLLVSIRREGGFCAIQGCFSEVAIFTDGTYRYSSSTSDPVTGRISNGKLQSLQNRISRLDPNDLYAEPVVEQPIDDFCALAFDGPETIYTFQTDGEVERVRGCDMAIDPDHPVVRKLERLYDRIVQKAQ